MTFRSMSIAALMVVLFSGTLTYGQGDVPIQEFESAGQLICAWRPMQAANVVQVCEELGFGVLRTTPFQTWVVCDWKDRLDPEKLNALRRNPGVLYVEPNYLRTASPLPSDVNRLPNDENPPGAVMTGQPTSFREDPFLNDKGLWGLKNIHAQEAWSVVHDSPIIVAVADSGVDYNHEDLRANMWRNPKEVPGDGIDNDKNGVVDDVFGADYIDTKVAKDPATGRAKLDPTTKRPIEITDGDPMDEHYHGTHVAGTIGAVGYNGVGVVGVNWRVQIMAVRCLGQDGYARADSIANSIKYAADNGAKVVNLSLGGRNSTQTELQAVKYARDRGVVLACAAGNWKEKDQVLDNDVKSEFPASYQSDNIIAVANIDRQDNLNPGSHFGRTSVHIGAPGTDVLSTFPMTKTPGMILEENEAKKEGKNITLPTKNASLTGTSMATPHVSGALALVLGHPSFQGRSAMDAKSAIISAARPLPSLSGKCTTGGTLDLAFLVQGTTPSQPPTPPIVCYPQIPTCYIYYVPTCQVPQHRCRIFGRRRSW